MKMIGLLIMIGLLAVIGLLVVLLWRSRRAFQKPLAMENLILADRNAQLVEQLKSARAELALRPPKPKRPPVLTNRAELLSGLNVEDTHPLLVSILSLLSAYEQEHLECGGVAGLAPDEAKAELRCVTCLQAAAEGILEETENARNANK